MKLIPVITNVLLFANLVSAAVLLISCMAPFISPQKFWVIGFLGLGFLPLLLVNLLWIIFWLLFGEGYALLSLIALILASWNISNHFSIAAPFTGTGKNSFSVMTFNVKVFDLYSWTNYPGSRDAILRVIETANPDVLCLQEFYEDDSEQLSTVERLKKKYPYFRFEKVLTLSQSHWGIVTFSKFPIAGNTPILFPGAFQNLAIATDIIIQNDTVRVFNAHMQSIYLGSHDYEDMLAMKGSAKIQPSWRIFKKIKEAFKMRATQAELLAEHIAKSSYPVLVCADFNDTPNSYTYHTIAAGLADSFKKAGFGMGRTFSSKRPVFRIDYILADKRFRILSHQVEWNYTSDHFAVKATLDLPQ